MCPEQTSQRSRIRQNNLLCIKNIFSRYYMECCYWERFFCISFCGHIEWNRWSSKQKINQKLKIKLIYIIVCHRKIFLLDDLLNIHYTQLFKYKMKEIIDMWSFFKQEIKDANSCISGITLNVTFETTFVQA